MVKMAVSSVVVLMVLVSSVLQVDGSQSYPLQKALESALTSEETLYTMRQAFFPVVHSRAQETQQVRITVCVHVTVDRTLNTTSNDSCIADKEANPYKIDSCKNDSSLYWRFLWSDSALLSLITTDQMFAFDGLTGLIYVTAHSHLGVIYISLPLICSVKQEKSDIKTSLMLLLSWVRYYS